MASTQKELAFSKSPLSGKLRFKLRTLNNFMFVIGVFAVFAFGVTLVPSEQPAYKWIADVVAIALLFYLYRVFWNKRAIWIRCPTCLKQIATNTPWICGSCQAKNEHVDDFPFVNRCEACGVEPKAYQCHYSECEKPIFLTKDELSRNYAFCINPPIKATEAELDHSDFEKKRRRAEYRLHLAQLNKNVETAEQAELEVKKKSQTPQEKIGEHREKRRSKTIIATEIYRNERKANAEKYKDDPEMLKMVNEDLEDWYRSGDWERIL